MGRIKLGISLKSLGQPFRRSLPPAQNLGVAGVELEAGGELLPQRLTQTGRREIGHLLRSHDLAVSGIVCPLRRGLDEAQDLEPRLEQIRLTMALAYDLGPRLVILQPGRLVLPTQEAAPPRIILGEESDLTTGGVLLGASSVPTNPQESRANLMKESLDALGKHGDRIGVTLALDVALDDPAATIAYLDRFDSGSLAINYNPANLVIAGFNPHDAIKAFQKRIAHVHAQDARRISPSKLATVPLGHGDIDWMQLLADFEAIEYHGYVTVLGDDHSEAAAGVAFLRRLVV